MKLLFCEKCGDLVVPSSKAFEARWCRCEASCCWWIKPASGEFACWSQYGRKSVSVVGLNNSLLFEPFPTHTNEAQGVVEFGCIQKDTMDKMIEEAPDTYLFKQLHSLVVRFRPGYSTDTIFAPAPPPHTVN